MRLKVAGALAVIFVFLCGCVENYSDTRIQANLWIGAGITRDYLVLPTPGLRPGEPGYFSHYELHAKFEGGGMVRLVSFLIQPLVHLDSPCYRFIADPFCIDSEEFPCLDYLVMDRFAFLEEIFGVISPGLTRPSADPNNPYGYEHMPGYNFMDWPNHLFVDPYEWAPGPKLARENLIREAVEEFCAYCLPKGYYLGNPIEFTLPYKGELFGTVDGPDPRNASAQGGFTIWLPGKLHGMTELLLIWEVDPSRLNEENINRTDLLPTSESRVFLVARRDASIGHIRKGEYRGVTTVFMESPYFLPVFMHAVVFEDLDEDPVNF